MAHELGLTDVNVNRDSGTAVITNVTGATNRSLRGDSHANPPTSSTTSMQLTIRITMTDSSSVSCTKTFIEP